jgi:hypothetical protein
MTAGLVAKVRVRTAGWLGLVVAMLTLAITAATAADPTFVIACYAMMGRIGGAVIPVFAVGTLVTGIALSVATRGGCSTTGGSSSSWF